MQRTALFVVSIYNYHREVFPVVREFAENGWRVAVVVGWLGTLADEAATSYTAVGCAIHRFPPGVAYGDPDQGLTDGRHSGKPTPSRPVHWRLVSVALEWRTMRRMRAAIRKLMESVAPDAVLCGPFHSCGTFDNAIAAWARDHRVPLCCYPVSTYHGAKGAIRARFNNLRLGMLPPSLMVRFDRLNGVLARLFPGWTQWRGKDGIFMWDPTRMLAAWAAGLLEEDIWQKPSPCMDAVFVFSEFSRRLLEDSGYPMRNVVVAGMPLLDVAFRNSHDPERRANVFSDIGVRERSEFLLFNVEPSAEHHYADWEHHWQNFRDMMRVVTACGLPVILSLHPLCREQDYAFAEREFGVRISRNHKIYDLYPHCRLAVSFPCSTNLVAEVFGKPLVIYDFFRIASEDSDRAAEYRLPFAKVGHSTEEVSRLIEAVLAQPAADADLLAREGGQACRAIRTHVERLIGGATDNEGTGIPGTRAQVKPGPGGMRCSS